MQVLSLTRGGVATRLPKASAEFGRIVNCPNQQMFEGIPGCLYRPETPRTSDCALVKNICQYSNGVDRRPISRRCFLTDGCHLGQLPDRSNRRSHHFDLSFLPS